MTVPESGIPAPACPQGQVWTPAECKCTASSLGLFAKLLTADDPAGLFTPPGVDRNITEDPPPDPPDEQPKPPTPPPTPPPGPPLPDPTPPVNNIDLSIEKSDSPDPVDAGGRITYTVTVTNSGPDAASGVVVRDTLSPVVSLVSSTSTQGSCGPLLDTVVCELGTVASQAVVTITIVVLVPSDFSGPLANSVEVDGDESNNDPLGNNSATESTEVLAPPPPDSGCALDVPNNSMWQGDGFCGFGLVDMSCSNPNELIIASPTQTVTCDGNGDCGDNNTILGRPNHKVTAKKQVDDIALEAIELDANGDPTGAQCVEVLVQQSISPFDALFAPRLPAPGGQRPRR